MPYIPLLSSTLPAATPGPHKTIGYALVRVPTREWSLPSPKFKAPSKRAGEPALRIRGCTWAVYYPATSWNDVTSKSDSGAASSVDMTEIPKHEATVQWMPEPVGGVLSGYDRYFGTSTSWLRTCTSPPTLNLRKSDCRPDRQTPRGPLPNPSHAQPPPPADRDGLPAGHLQPWHVRDADDVFVRRRLALA